MRRRGAGRGRAPVEEDPSISPDDAGDAPWGRCVGPYPVSSFALDHALPERGKDATLRACEAEFRAFDGNLQAPTIRRFLWAGFVSAAARLANPLLRYQTKFAALSPTCRLMHVGAGVWGVVEESASSGSGSVRHSPAISPWQSPTPSPQYEFR